ncbi:MAG: VCBS repeat-containing protein [Verrucomicrobiales bacterium]|nr:VCBS repeat-containing protein [Verrucomicrobiales bacterium]
MTPMSIYQFYFSICACALSSLLASPCHAAEAPPTNSAEERFLLKDRAKYRGVPDSVLRLRRRACAICHTVPDPQVMPKNAWETIILDMAEHLRRQQMPLTQIQTAQLQHFYQSYSLDRIPRLPDDFLPPKLNFEKHAVGNASVGERPHITNVNITDLDQDGNPDVIVCDELIGTVSWLPYHKNLPPKQSAAEEIELALVSAPVHSEVFDFDGDGDLDIAIASMGHMNPNDLLIGEAVLLINDGQQNFTKRVLISGTPRISDMQPGDLDGDGDIDFGLAMFGWRSTGAVGWLEQVTPEKFELHILSQINGVMHMELVDLDQDGRLDIVTLLSQQHEMILRYMNRGKGKFEPFVISQPRNPTFGSSGFQMIDMDQDGDLDILYSNGDLMDTDSTPKPYHGIQWLENDGKLNFTHHDITRFHSCYRAVAADMDGDGDLDVIASNLYYNWHEYDYPSLIWLENDGKQNFKRRRIAYAPSNLGTIDVGDLNGDGRPDIIGGGMHVAGPLGRVGRLTMWKNLKPAE